MCSCPLSQFRCYETNLKRVLTPLVHLKMPHENNWFPMKPWSTPTGRKRLVYRETLKKNTSIPGRNGWIPTKCYQSMEIPLHVNSRTKRSASQKVLPKHENTFILPLARWNKRHPLPKWIDCPYWVDLNDQTTMIWHPLPKWIDCPY